jgi:polysaccharide chain length determinant protein (PEP-CTERM system associated)
MLGHRDMTMEDYVGIVRRRIWLLIVPPIALCIGAYFVSRIIPPRFASTTQVIVQAQSVSTEIVAPIITGQMNERLASMKEQILSRSHLQPLIERFSIFKDTKLSPEAKIQNLHDAIQVDPIHAMEDTRASQLPGFKITVTLGSARLAQQVCSEIYLLFSEEEGKTREARAEGETSFLDKVLDDARKKMNDQDARLATFKAKYIGSLPEDEASSLGMISTLSTQLDAVTQGLDRDQQTKTFTESMLQQQLSNLKNSQNSMITDSGSPDNLQEQLKKAQEDLVKLRAQYTEEYPDVQNKVREIEQLKQKIIVAQAVKPVTKSTEKQGEAASTSSVPEPASIQQLRATLGSIEISLKDKAKQQQELRNKIQMYEARIQLRPVVEQQYKELTRDFATAEKEYQTLLTQQGTVSRSAELDRQQQGEQFRILDAANLPEKPIFPNKLFFVAGGFGAGIGLGAAMVLLLEMKDKSLRTETDIELFLKIPTLAMVPMIDKRASTPKRFVFAAGKDDESLEAHT